MAQDDTAHEARLQVAMRVQQARLNAGLTIDEAVARTKQSDASVSVVTWINIEKARPVRPLSYRAVEKLFDWEVGSIQRYITTYVPDRGVTSGETQALRESARQIRPATLPRDTGPVPPAFGQWLTTTRQRAGYATSRDLAQAANFPAELVEAWEHGDRRPEIWECHALADALGVSEWDVMAESGRLHRAARALQDLADRRSPDDPEIQAIQRIVQGLQDRT